MSEAEHLKILVVEDEDLHWDLFVRNLRKSRERWAQKPARAKTIKEATEALSPEKFDVIVLDLNLPDSDSTLTISEGIAKFRNFPVVVLTSLDDEELGRQAMKEGAQDFLAKEAITPEILKRSIRYAIERFEIQKDLFKKNTDLEMFAKTLAHEIRNPLHVVLLTLGRLRDYQKLRLGDEEYLSMVDRALGGVTNINSVISELLVLALAERGKGLEKIDMHSLVKTVAEEAKQKPEAEFSLTIKNHISEVVGNGQQLKQVFQNLFSNAIRYRDFDRPLEITIHSEEITTSAKFCRIYFTDNGIGIPQPEIKHVFEPLFRATHEVPREGTGLGLYYCKTSLEKFGGNIDVVSRVDKGTTFIVDILLPDNDV